MDSYLHPHHSTICASAPILGANLHLVWHDWRLFVHFNEIEPALGDVGLLSEPFRHACVYVPDARPSDTRRS